MRKLLAFALALVFLPAVHASSVHVSRKAFVKETNKILDQYTQELYTYGHVAHPGVSAISSGLYVQRATLDYLLVYTDLSLYERNKRTQDDVSTSLRQLSRDLEDKPAADGQ